MNKTQILSKNYDMVVFSHLRWEFVIQRPQHIINRMAKNRKILFVEEPIPFDNKNRGTANVIDGGNNITVIQPRIPYEAMVSEGVEVVEEYINDLKLKNPILWFYAPMYSDMLNRIEHSLVVYDCMDELAAFKGAPVELITNEKYLISQADVVFTGGKSLYESKKKLHNNVYCFPSSVDRKHFEKVSKKSTTIPADLATLQHPVVGFYGVIDERIDLTLLDTVSKSLPDISFVMIGPVVKIDEAELPRNPNVHYLGGKSYDELPHYLKGIDIAMMPFAMNQHTKYISPTKTLEFMAALKPIISTPIYDVVRDYKKEVAISSSAKEFVKAIKTYLKETPAQKKIREQLETEIIDRTSWDNTALAMQQIMAEQLELSANVSAVDEQEITAPYQVLSLSRV
ncbi:MAG: glycosyltransferase [Patescibacteria group bacterium]